MSVWRLLFAVLVLAPPARAEDLRVRVNGHDVHLDVVSATRRDAAQPTIVFESGLGTSGTRDWEHVLPLLPTNAGGSL